MPLQMSGFKHGPLIWALSLFFLVYAGLQVWALIGMWYIMGIQGFQIKGPY